MPILKSRLKKKPPRYDPQRKERMRVYNTAKWRKLRDLKMKDQPLCEVCLSKGIIKQADEVHHIESFMSYDTRSEQFMKAYSYNNLQSICKQCHQREHHGGKREGR